jgi:hypothetical protein
MFLLKIERDERPPHGLTATEGGQTASLYKFCGMTATEGSHTANLCIAHGVTATEADQTASISNGRISNLKVAVTTATV